jgi:hypothetical protein
MRKRKDCNTVISQLSLTMKGRCTNNTNNHDIFENMKMNT